MSSEAKAPEKPKSLFDKVGVALPIALTAIATAFAGMSSSEMSQAMYWRSAAAQDQAKANDQWSFAGFKRDRSLIVDTTATTMRAMAEYQTPPNESKGPQTPPPAIVDHAGKWMATDPTTKDPPLPPVEDKAIQDVLVAIHLRKSEAEVLKLAKEIDETKLTEAINAAAMQATEVEKVYEPERDQARKATRDATDAIAKSEGPARAKAIAMANVAHANQYEVDGRRYRSESTMNFWVGYLYEVRVKTSTATSDTHREKSKNFFYAMLAAQIGATISSLGLARRYGSALWGLAGFAGLVAIVIGVYVYLGM